MSDNSGERRGFGVNVGSASIVMIFAVLCLVVLATLTLLSANSEQKLAARSAQAVSDYYAADAQALDIYAALHRSIVEQGNTPAQAARETDGVQLLSAAQGGFLSYAVDIDGQQQLQVLLEPAAERLEVVAWQAVTVGEWEVDTYLHVWSGD
ncbi:MAG: hypothetical protein Q4B96_07645 [Bacillota bacterium]|nr:hypothetical protein [Bacillota bacterium]